MPCAVRRLAVAWMCFTYQLQHSSCAVVRLAAPCCAVPPLMLYRSATTLRARSHRRYSIVSHHSALRRPAAVRGVMLSRVSAAALGSALCLSATSDMLRCAVIDALAICRIACTVTFAVLVSHHRALRRPEAGGGVDVLHMSDAPLSAALVPLQAHLCWRCDHRVLSLSQNRGVCCVGACSPV